MAPVLTIVSGPQAGRRVDLSTERAVRVGRTAKSECMIAEDSYMSGMHFEVCYSGGKWVARDLNSSNGTFLNGQRITEAAILPGDALTAGQSTFAIDFNAVTDTATTVNYSTQQLERVAASAPAPPPIELTPVRTAVAEVLRGVADPLFAVVAQAGGDFVEHMRQWKAEAVEVLPADQGAAVYVVAIDAESRLLDHAVDAIWGRESGFFLTSRSGVESAGAHLTAILSPVVGGTPVRLRLWKPALLDALLGSLNAEEARVIFGPALGIFREGAKASELSISVPGATGVVSKTVELKEGTGA